MLLRAPLSVGLVAVVVVVEGILLGVVVVAVVGLKGRGAEGEDGREWGALVTADACVRRNAGVSLGLERGVGALRSEEWVGPAAGLCAKPLRLVLLFLSAACG